MRLQSSIEFMSTYSFLLISLGIVISILLFVTVLPKTTFPISCTAFSGPTCNFLNYYVNSSYSLLTFSITNSQSTPINITNMSVSISGHTGTGVCDPAFVLPGEYSTCIVPMQGYSPNVGILLNGFYTINGKACSSGVSSVLQSNCTYTSAQYGGSFSTTPTTKEEIIFSVIAFVSPPNVQIPQYSGVPMPFSSFSVVQNGDWVAYSNNSRIYYAFGTQSYQGQTYMGIKVQPFPITVSTLNNNNVHCNAPYNTAASIAYAPLYLPTTTTVGIVFETDDGMAVYYQEYGSSVWMNVSSNSAWHGQGATRYPTNSVYSITLNNGVDKIAAAWFNACAPGMQLLNITT